MHNHQQIMRKFSEDLAEIIRLKAPFVRLPPCLLKTSIIPTISLRKYLSNFADQDCPIPESDRTWDGGFYSTDIFVNYYYSKLLLLLFLNVSP